MEALDTEKLKEILEIMKANGAVFLKYNDLIIEFNRADKCGSSSTDAIGFEAAGDGEPVYQNEDAKAAANAAKIAGLGPRPVGYTALFGNALPTFPRPSAEGRHA